MNDEQGNLKVDRLLLVLLLLVMVVSAIVDTMTNQDIEDSIQKTDIITQCLDPTSECAKLQAESNRREQQYLESLMKTTNICVLNASRQAPNGSIEEITKLYDECVKVGSPPPPVPVTEEDAGD